MTDIEQQARKEAECTFYRDGDRIVQRLRGRDEFGDPQVTEHYMPVEAAIAMHEELGTALISERSKPTATCEPIYGDYGGINGCSCSNCSAPIGPPEFSRYCGNCARKVLWPEGANYQTHPPKPSLMVGFSEEEIERMVLLADSEAFRRDDGELMMSGFGNGYFAGLRLANTRAVSIDRLVEVVDEWMQDRDGAGSIVYTDLRERLMKIMP